MAHKTFLKYKYSEAQDLRDRIIKALGDDASYYQGEDWFCQTISCFITSPLIFACSPYPRQNYPTMLNIFVLSFPNHAPSLH